MKKQLIQLHFANYFTKFFLVSLITNSAVSEAQKLSVTPSLFSQEERSHPITYFKKLTDGSLSLLELKPETKQADAPVVCYTITNPSAAQTICVDATGSNITVNTNMNLGGGIRFVRFTTDQMAGSTPTLAESNFIYSYTPGTFKDIAYVTPTGGSSPYTATYTFYSPDFPNTTNAPITYYVYAVFNQGVVNSTCGINPAVEIQITVKPKPTVNAIADQYVCAGSATSAVTLTGSGVSGTTYAWTNTTTSIGLAASGSTTIPSFTAVNATSNPVTATITATPTANSCTGDPLTSKIVVYPTGATMISGVAFNDYNENGIREAAEGVQAGIVAKVYNSAGTLMGTSTTDANGYWSVSGLTFGGANDKYRVEFSIPTALSTTGMQPSVKGTSNGTDVQFVSAASCNINFGVNYPGVYCQTNPVLATPCYTNGSRASNPNDAAVVLFNYNDRGQGLSHEMIATVSEVGAVWGETYNPKNKKLYVSAFIKRHVDLAPNGLGAIYEIDVTTPTTAGAGTPTLWLDINAATFVNTSNVAVNLGMPADPGIATRGLGLKTDPSRDNWAFDYVGKQGIGDIELSQDGQRLYVMDLTNRQVLCIDYTTKKLIWKLAVSTPTCAGGSTDIRPWALKEHNGVLYVGALCSGETNNNAGQLHFYVMQCNSLTAATSMSLTADLGSSVTKQDGTPWQYWAANATEAGIASTPNDGYMNGAQPIISNIDFDKDENMIIGFMDRFGHQVGFANYLPNTTNTNLVHGIAHGDITRATKSGSTYTVETAPWSFFYLTAAIPSPPYDHFGGGMFVSSLSGTNYVTANVIDPFDYVSAGTTWVKTSDGQRQGGTNATSRLEIVPNSTSTAYFGKANGLGDLSAFCNPAPIQIGNYVWYDLNKNGVQDPNEIPLSNIAVTLWKGGTQIASTTTDANGNYYFSDKNAAGVTWTGTGADTTLLANTAYEVRILMSQTGITSQNYQLTTANSTTNNGNDQNDSDASISSGYAVIAVTTGAAGSINHTYDFGFYGCSITVVSAVPTACNGTTNKYSLAVTVAYSDQPAGNIKISIGDFGTYFFVTPDGTSPDVFTITNLSANGIQNVDVSANFVNNANCISTLVNAYNAPASCGNYCPGNLVQNPSFETTTGGGTAPYHSFYTPASWTVGTNTGYGEQDWLLPDGVGFLSLSGTTNTTATQNIPVTVGNAHTLTFYSAMHFPLINNATATIQYYNASNVALGSAVVHTVSHDWEDDHTLGGPYTLTLGAAPTGTSYLRITLKNNAGAYVGESVKFDAFCLTASPCTVTGCDVLVNPIRIVGRQNNTSPDAEGRVFQNYELYDLPCWQAGGGGTITNTNTGAPNGTSNQEVYQYGVWEYFLDWHFAVPSGSYTILLHYSENSWTAANQRKFDVFIEDTQVENDFDIFAQTGAQRKALVKSYTTTVTDDDLNLRFEKVVDAPHIQGVEIIPNFCTAKQAVSITNVNVSGCYRNSSGQSKSTVSVEVSWDNALARDSIQVTLGSQTRWIFPGQYNTGGVAGTIMSPQVVSFEVDANGAAGSVTATMFNNNDCNATSNFNAPAACPATTCTTGQLGGTVFNDYDADGIKDAGETYGTSGVTVTVFDCIGNTATTTTDFDGKWKISTALTYPVRVEFSNLPATVGTNGTPNGTDGRTTVQFVNAADCSVDLGVLNATDYCQANPDIFLPCFVNGDPLPGGSTAGTYDAFIRLPYGTTGLSPTMTHVASASQVGTLWGVAYDKKRNKVYSSAVLRRHAGLGPLGLGGIYQVNPTTNATSTFVDVQSTLGINVGGLSGGPFFGVTNTSRGLSTNPLTPTHDSLAFAQIGKIGIGDMDISENSDYLYFVNLYDKKLYKLNITGASPTVAASYSIPAACANGNSRPFALKVKGGVVYVGVVCDGSTSKNRSDLRAYVYGLSESSGTFSTIFDFPLTYPKGFPINGLYQMGNWRPWTDNFDDIDVQYIFGSSLCSYPQPILSDIETDLDGSLVLGFADRSGFQLGWVNYSVKNSDVSTYTVYPGGDILRAAYKNGAYFLENNAYLAGVTGAGSNNNQGPGFGEFYSDNYYDAGTLIHSEIAFGALALKPGSGQTIFTVQDPIDNNGNSAGFRYISNTTGLSPSGTSAGARVYASPSSVYATFGKAVGLGDMELNCGNVTYLQVGNYVWQDSNKDGVQDPCEPPLSNVTVTLWKGGTQIASTTTDANGEYYFSDKNASGVTWTGTGADTTLLPTTAYEVRIDTSNQSAFIKLALTTANSTTNNGNDQNDNDAVTTGKYKVISFTTGAVGSVNHTYDFGFYPFCDTTLVVTNTTICNGSTVDLFTLASGVKGTLSYSTNGTTWTALTSPTNVTPSVTTTYYIKDTLVSGCFDIDTLVITVNPTPTTPSVSSPITNICPLTTVDLTVISSALTPSVSGGVFEWHVSNSSGSALVSNPNDVVAGDYYLFERSPAGCYSTGKKVTVAIQVCCPSPACIPVTITRTN